MATTPGGQWRQNALGAWEYLASDGRWYQAPAAPQQPPSQAQQPIYPQYGQMVPYGGQYFVPTTSQGNGQAIAALVLGITSIIFCWWGVMTLAQVVLALIFGGVGISKANKGAPNRGIAVAGLVLGLIGLVFHFLIGLASFGAGWII